AMVSAVGISFIGRSLAKAGASCESGGAEPTSRRRGGEFPWGRPQRLAAARVDAVLRHVDNIVADVKADDRVVNAVVRADAGDYHVVSTQTQIESFEPLFHRGL